MAVKKSSTRTPRKSKSVSTQEKRRPGRPRKSASPEQEKRPVGRPRKTSPARSTRKSKSPAVESRPGRSRKISPARSPKCKYGQLKNASPTGRKCKKSPGRKRSPTSQPLKSPKGSKTLFCLKCRKKVAVPRKDICVKQITLKYGRGKRYLLKSKHEECGTMMNQFIAADKASTYKNC